MKKNKSVLLAFFIMLYLFVSCSQDDANSSKEENMQDAVSAISENGLEPESEIEKVVKQNPEHYLFEDSNSHLWVDENENPKLSKTANITLVVKGYNTKSQISTGKMMFPKKLKCDTRIYSFPTYITKKMQYKVIIKIPKGNTLILPPESVMTSMRPMGLKPGTNQLGYKEKLISSDNTYTTYELITEGSEITHEISGRQCASLDNPVYIPCDIQNPDNIEFKYQYSNIEW